MVRNADLRVSRNPGRSAHQYRCGNRCLNHTTNESASVLSSCTRVTSVSGYANNTDDPSASTRSRCVAST